MHNNVHKVIHILEQDWLKDPALHENILAAFKTAEAASSQLTGLVDKLATEKMESEGFANDSATGK